MGMLRSFLQKAACLAKPAFAAGTISDPARKITLCIGNEASDADSIVSSLCLAYLKQQQHVGEDKTFVPVVAVPRSILKLRRETQLLLRSVGLELEDLICLDELDLQKMSDDLTLQAFVLTDHNLLGKCVTSKLKGGEAQAASLVESIVDHHKDQGAYSACAGTARIIAFDSMTNTATAGSACTLVAELVLKAAPALSATSFSAIQAIQDVSVLLQGVICIDTQNMDPRGVGTTRDASALDGLLVNTTGRVDRDSTFATLRDAKSAPEFWNELSAMECLCIDYKQFPQATGAEVGIASTLLPVQQFLEKHGSTNDVRQYMACPTLERKSCVDDEDRASECEPIQPLELLLVMSTVYRPKFRRELLIVSYDEARADALAFFLQGTGDATMLEPLSLAVSASAPDIRSGNVGEIGKLRVAGADGVSLHMRAFHQGNSKASRKQIAPLVQEFYSAI